MFINVKYRITIIVLIALCYFGSKAFAQNSATPVTWGINGHPLTQVAYGPNADKQIADLKDLGVSSYRFDVLLDSDGYARKDQAFTQLLVKLNSNGIAALPVLMQKGFKDLDNDAIYKLSYTQGRNFASRYGKYLTVVEVNNEADLKIMLPGNLGGTKQGDFDPVKSQRVIGGIKGFIDGLKSVAPKTKVTLSVSYTHYYYLQLLKDSNVQYDIVGCHWYSNMGPINNARPNGIDMLKVVSRFNKPVWVTEMNYSKGTLKADFTKQSDYLNTAIPEMITNGVTGIFIYELYDQPALSRRNPAEAHYGLSYSGGDTSYNRKDAYQTYKQLIQKFK